MNVLSFRLYVPVELAGQQIQLTTFDTDSGFSYPLCFYFDTLPNPQCISGFEDPGEGYMVYYDEENDDVSGVERCFPMCNDQFVSPALSSCPSANRSL